MNYLHIILFLSFSYVFSCGCAAQGDLTGEDSRQNTELVNTGEQQNGKEAEIRDNLSPAAEVLDPKWQSLEQRLIRDNFLKEDVHPLLLSLLSPSASPMGVKVKELYTKNFLIKKKPATTTKRTPRKPSKWEYILEVPGPWYAGVVTKATAEKCIKFIQDNQAAFIEAENKYKVPSEIAAALLFVETRLGEYMGKDNAFYMLASMTVMNSTSDVQLYIDKLSGAEKHLPWIQKKMTEKSEWAYKELKALIIHCQQNKIDPLQVKGSIYGAIGLCQFMPSNISKLAVDGDNDGIVNIFTVPDAVASLSNYLSKTGWSNSLSVQQKTKVVMKYNASYRYARSILALAKYIELMRNGEDMDALLKKYDEKAQQPVKKNSPKKQSKKKKKKKKEK